MRLKSFHAKTVTEAMQMIRETLGEDAIIVATREENGGKSVRVTAAVEQDSFESYDEFEHGAADPGERVGGWLQYDDEESEGGVAEILTETMLRHSVPEEITDQVISCATVVGLEQPHIALVAALEHLFAFKPLPESASDKAFMLVGPPGCGKTLAAAKMAARAVMNGQRVNLITTDTLRAGGVEQLASFAKILNVPLQKARDSRELERALNVFGDADLTIIDSGGFNPFRGDEMRDLARMTAAGNIDPVLVLPAGLDTEECAEMARIYAALGVRQMLASRIDLARRLGGLLTAAHQGSLIFSDASDNAKAADGILDL